MLYILDEETPTAGAGETVPETSEEPPAENTVATEGMWEKITISCGTIPEKKLPKFCHDFCMEHTVSIF